MRVVVPVLLLLAVMVACGRRRPTVVDLGPSAPTADRASELVERADRGRVRPLPPPAAPDTRAPQAARPAPQRTVKPLTRPAHTGDGWARLRQCESGGDYTENTGNGFYGAYQFDLRTWRSVGGTEVPSSAPAAEQDARAQLLYARRGPQPWPQCGRWLR